VGDHPRHERGLQLAPVLGHVLDVGPGRCCSPRHNGAHDSRNEDPKYVLGGGDVAGDGPGRYSSPPHSVPFKSNRQEGPTRVSMTWRINSRKEGSNACGCHGDMTQETRITTDCRSRGERYPPGRTSIHGPLKMHNTVQSSVYVRLFSSLGVSRKVCGVDASDQGRKEHANHVTRRHSTQKDKGSVTA
jgi:hypothetical protein